MGSITHIADASGKLLAEYGYDAWGRMRNPVNQSVYVPGSEPELLLGRGYTGHEHLSVFGLVNMNARLYDPVLGRFLSPDPFVQLPDNLRSLNRYGYGMCNPLCYVDENGEFWWIVAAAVIGGFVNAGIHSDQINSLGSFFGYFGVGAAAGALGTVTGGAIAGAVGLSGVAGGAIVGAGSGAVGGALLGAGNAVMAGGNLGDILGAGLSGAASGALSGAVMGGTIGGAVSYFKGQNVWTGADIASGRSPFSFKNTPVEGGVKVPKVAVEPDVMPNASQPSKPMASVTPSDEIGGTSKVMTSHEKGEAGTLRTIEDFESQGGKVFSREVSIDLDGGVRTRLDFVGELRGKLYLYEAKNGISAGLTTNQKINMPKMLMDKPIFTPAGENALKVKFPGFTVGEPYTGPYIVVYKHYF